MTASELKIGNWVEANTPPMIVKVISESTVALYMPGSEADNFHFDIEDLRPIPLSESILEKCGFELSLITNDWFIDLQTHYLSLIFSGDQWYPQYHQLVEMSHEREQIVGLNFIQHLHQLQNLFWCLCGKELNVNIT